jgi:hypothetical protein
MEEIMMKNKSFREEVEEYCDLLIECAKNDEVSNELIDKKKRIIELFKKEEEKGLSWTEMIRN